MKFLDATIDLGTLHIKNRVFMAPLTRNRAAPDGTPGPWAETYYRQRSSAGLIITEATQISAMGKGYIHTPGIYLPQHIAAWRKIVGRRSCGRRPYLPAALACRGASPTPACYPTTHRRWRRPLSVRTAVL